MIRNQQPARLRALAMELKAARALSGKTTRQAAKAMGLSIASLNRSETAKRISPIRDIAGLLALYGVIGADRDRILDLAENLDAREWLETGDHARLMAPFVGFEAQAQSIAEFAPAYIPGLLQTPAYVRAIMALATTDDQGREERIATRLERQKILAKRVSPTYVAIIDEAVLRRSFGGPEVMVQQLHWLIGRAALPHITIQVIPFKHGGYKNPGAYVLYGFRSDLPIVYIENHGASGFLHTSVDIDKFQGATAALARHALGAADSVNFLKRMVADYERS